MYGSKPRLPVNLYFGTQGADMNTTTSTIVWKNKEGVQNCPTSYRKREQTA